LALSGKRIKAGHYSQRFCRPGHHGLMEIWFNPSCSKCRLAKEMLDEAGTDYVVRRYLEDPPTATEIEEALDRLGLQPWDITRMNEPAAKELGLAERPRDRAEWVGILAEHPSLIQRPIILTADGSAWVARSPEEVEKAIVADR
jgi:arsenate reductase